MTKHSEQLAPTILLVDDDQSLLRLMTIRLEGEGFDCDR